MWTTTPVALSTRTSDGRSAGAMRPRTASAEARPRLRRDVLAPVRRSLAQGLEHLAQRAQHGGPAVGGDERRKLGPLERLVDGRQQPARIDRGGRGHGQEHT